MSHTRGRAGNGMDGVPSTCRRAPEIGESCQGMCVVRGRPGRKGDDTEA